MKRFSIFASLFLLVACAGVNAQDYPNKPVTIYVPFAAGGGTDLSLRMLEEAVSKNLGQKVVIVNKTGTATIYQVVTGPADGYNLVVGSTGNLAAVPHNPGAPPAATMRPPAFDLYLQAATGGPRVPENRRPVFSLFYQVSASARQAAPDRRIMARPQEASGEAGWPSS